MPNAAMSPSDHPCFHGSARGRWGRIHLPVAPGCNVQCNFCNRKYDCANESRPAVTNYVLKPGEVVSYLDVFLKARSDIAVVGIAGPGDPLCDPQRTLNAIRAVRRAYPGLLLCLSTNGLDLPGHIDELAESGVTHVTVTVNAVDPDIGRRIYAWIRMEGKLYRDREAAEWMISRQREAIVKLKAKGFTVKINTVLLPGVNTDHIPDIAAEVAVLGADVMNCISLIPLPHTPFESLEMPTKEDVDRIRRAASSYMPQMYHCRRCRSDAAGLLHQGRQGDMPVQACHL